ncbi:hypothetical protein FBU30_000049 [Linnemannia zychae]|nr:hypothetical protein FBU30_000049 [Linnemannia zychae]
MSLPYIDPKSPIFSSKFVQTKGLQYHYIEAGDPKGEPLLLVHGFPDLWYGWRYQIKFFAELGYRVIAVDCLGYGKTDSPKELEKYGLKALSDQLAGLLDALDIPKVTIIGHDWGGAVAWRFGLYHPDRLNEVIKLVPEFEYQRAFNDPATTVKLDEDKRSMLKGVLALGCCDGEAELDYMTEEYSRSGFHGPLNYYKTGRINFDDEIAAFPETHQRIIHTPSWMIIAENDPYLRPRLAQNMHTVIPNLKTTTIEAGHFCLTEKWQEVNALLKTAVEDLLAGKAAKASL